MVCCSSGWIARSAAAGTIALALPAQVIVGKTSLPGKFQTHGWFDWFLADGAPFVTVRRPAEILGLHVASQVIEFLRNLAVLGLK